MPPNRVRIRLKKRIITDKFDDAEGDSIFQAGDVVKTDKETAERLGNDVEIIEEIKQETATTTTTGSGSKSGSKKKTNKSGSR